jgi:hypothetical protein
MGFRDRPITTLAPFLFKRLTGFEPANKWVATTSLSRLGTGAWQELVGIEPTYQEFGAPGDFHLSLHSYGDDDGTRTRNFLRDRQVL